MKRVPVRIIAAAVVADTVEDLEVEEAAVLAVARAEVMIVAEEVMEAEKVASVAVRDQEAIKDGAAEGKRLLQSL
jgi:hypothetical protein